MSKHLFVGGSLDGKLLDMNEPAEPTVIIGGFDGYKEEYHCYKVVYWNHICTSEPVLDEWVYFLWPEFVADAMRNLMGITDVRTADPRWFHNKEKENVEEGSC